MRFRTELSVEKSAPLAYDAKLLLIGSCFSDEIGARLSAAGFDVAVNPCGTLYNPMSIAATLRRFISPDSAPGRMIVERDGLFHSMEHHTRFSGPTRDAAMRMADAADAAGREALSRADTVVITWGTAWVYELASTGRLVANCHKLPASEFNRRILTVDEIVGEWRLLLGQLSGKRVIMTVSPIRHLADGLHGNQLSKATLLLAADRLGVEYFPAYEALVDDLRDYRFYADDMTHPSAKAVDYVWEIFAASYFTPDTARMASQRIRESRGAAHRTIAGSTGA